MVPKKPQMQYTKIPYIGQEREVLLETCQKWTLESQKSKLIFASVKVSLCFQKMICWVASNHKIVSSSVSVALYDFNQILGSQHELIKISQNQKLYLIILKKMYKKEDESERLWGWWVLSCIICLKRIIWLFMKNKRSIVNQPRFIFNLGHSSKDESNVSHDSSSLLILSYWSITKYTLKKYPLVIG